MKICDWIQKQLFGNPRVFSFRILNPDKDIMYDDLLGPELVSGLNVYPAQELSTSHERILILESESESVTSDMILNILQRHKVEARLLSEKQKFD